MSFIRGGETITIKRRTVATEDDYGNPTHTVTTIVVKDALIAIGTTNEPVDPSRDPVDAQLTLYLPPGTRIQDGDRFVIRGTEFHKDGAAFAWTSPFGSQFEGGVIVPLRKRNG